MKEGTAVYAGTFDPPTNGHVWMIEQGIEIFNPLPLIVAVGVNPEKHCLFSLEERVEMLHQITKSFPTVRVESFPYMLLIHYAQRVGARFILRGIRNFKDYEYENDMRNMNRREDPTIETVFLMPPQEIREVSSGMVKGFMGPERGDEVVEKYVPPFVFKKLKEAYDAKQK
ncbi:MAG: pantetheine-phosphate adenylyltransferase [bacterium]|nr:pantetheine-phosphate adenylyltransferase [bacterium]